ncbi:hypothetical protein [Streptomyces sp. NBC_01089]|uniref:hypothetical protein n=1 Tax=Streptomyces sp. NBC_01089 TaxID=2903747 RepID=UPI0038704AE6
MNGAGTRLGVGTCFRLDGETVEFVEFASLATGMEVILKDARDRLIRMSVRELLTSGRAEVIVEDPEPATDDGELAAVVLSRLTKEERKDVLERAGHVREVLTGYRSGSEELSQPGEPRAQYAPGHSLKQRYAAKASELGVTARSVQRWVSAFQESGEVGLVSKRAQAEGGLAHADPRWVEVAEEVLDEYTEESRPSVKLVLDRVQARLEERFGPGTVPLPKRTAGYRWMHEFERRHPLFRRVGSRRSDADEHLVRTRAWWLELSEPHHLRAAVAVVLKALHEAYSFEISVA